MTQTTFKPCGATSPHAPKKVVRKVQDRMTTVERNRPYGHDGNHAWSTGTHARVAEWTRDGKVVR